jgi:hypothetical protein
MPDPQLRVYQAVQGISGKGAGEHIALHDRVFLDTRIPPAGFQASVATKPQGTTWFDDGDGGYRNYDLITYRVAVPSNLPAGTAQVSARLMYQTTTREYVDFLSRENRTDDKGIRLKEIYEATGRSSPVEVARGAQPLDVITIW